MVQVIADVKRSKMSSHSSNTAQRLHVLPCSGPPASSPASAPYHQHHHDDLFLFLLVPLLVLSLVHLPPCKSSCKYTLPHLPSLSNLASPFRGSLRPHIIVVAIHCRGRHLPRTSLCRSNWTRSRNAVERELKEIGQATSSSQEHEQI